MMMRSRSAGGARRLRRGGWADDGKPTTKRLCCQVFTLRRSFCGFVVKFYTKTMFYQDRLGTKRRGNATVVHACRRSGATCATTTAGIKSAGNRRTSARAATAGESQHRFWPHFPRDDLPRQAWVISNTQQETALNKTVGRFAVAASSTAATATRGTPTPGLMKRRASSR
jgi:hypothetical protein